MVAPGWLVAQALCVVQRNSWTVSVLESHRPADLASPIEQKARGPSFSKPRAVFPRLPGSSPLQDDTQHLSGGVWGGFEKKEKQRTGLPKGSVSSETSGPTQAPWLVCVVPRSALPGRNQSQAGVLCWWLGTNAGVGGRGRCLCQGHFGGPMKPPLCWFPGSLSQVGGAHVHG